MIEYANKLKTLPATQAYVDFGLKQVEAINNRFKVWHIQQSFAGRTSSSIFERMTVKGHSNDREYDDKIEWDLQFSRKVRNKDLADALLHEHRIHDITTFNSKPTLFDSADYIQISVTNGEKGWVEKGEFPINVHIGKDYHLQSDNPHETPTDIAIQTNVRREALAGFEVAYQWQCFRAMALASSVFVSSQLVNESKDIIDDDSGRHMRSRKENVYPLFLELLPNLKLENTQLALKSFYKPGTLEGALALELEHAIHHQFGVTKTGEVRPIYQIKGYPIGITQTSKGYDALMSFDVQTFSKGLSRGPKDDEQVRLVIENQLVKHFAIKLKNPYEMQVAFALKDAHQVEQAIQEGVTNTKIHEFAEKFRDTLNYINTSLDRWYNAEAPNLKKTYEKAIDDARNKHFLALKTKLADKIK